MKIRLGLNILTDLTLENLLGTKDKLTNLELAMQAELIHKLITFGGKEYNAKVLVKSVLMVILTGEKLTSEQRTLFKSLTTH